MTYLEDSRRIPRTMMLISPKCRTKKLANGSTTRPATPPIVKVLPAQMVCQLGCFELK